MPNIEVVSEFVLNNAGAIGALRAFESEVQSTIARINGTTATLSIVASDGVSTAVDGIVSRIESRAIEVPLIAGDGVSTAIDKIRTEVLAKPIVVPIEAGSSVSTTAAAAAASETDTAVDSGSATSSGGMRGIRGLFMARMAMREAEAIGEIFKDAHRATEIDQTPGDTDNQAKEKIKLIEKEESEMMGIRHGAMLAHYALFSGVESLFGKTEENPDDEIKRLKSELSADEASKQKTKTLEQATKLSEGMRDRTTDIAATASTAGGTDEEKSREAINLAYIHAAREADKLAEAIAKLSPDMAVGGREMAESLKASAAKIRNAKLEDLARDTLFKSDSYQSSQDIDLAQGRGDSAEVRRLKFQQSIREGEYEAQKRGGDALNQYMRIEPELKSDFVRDEATSKKYADATSTDRIATNTQESRWADLRASDATTGIEAGSGAREAGLESKNWAIDERVKKLREQADATTDLEKKTRLLAEAQSAADMAGHEKADNLTEYRRHETDLLASRELENSQRISKRQYDLDDIATETKSIELKSQHKDKEAELVDLESRNAKAMREAGNDPTRQAAERGLGNARLDEYRRSLEDMHQMQVTSLEGYSRMVLVGEHGQADRSDISALQQRVKKDQEPQGELSKLPYGGSAYAGSPINTAPPTDEFKRNPRDKSFEMATDQDWQRRVKVGDANVEMDARYQPPEEYTRKETNPIYDYFRRESDDDQSQGAVAALPNFGLGGTGGLYGGMQMPNYSAMLNSANPLGSDASSPFAAGGKFDQTVDKWVPSVDTLNTAANTMKETFDNAPTVLILR